MTPVPLIQRIEILGTQGTCQAHIYDRTIEIAGPEAILPEDFYAISTLGGS